jgi:OOP family OmpA-OmpF porin
MRSVSKALLLVSLGLATGAAVADDGRGFYVGFGAGAARWDVDQDEVDSMVVGAFESLGLTMVSGNSKLSESDASLGVIVGFRFLPYLAVEGEYLTLGTADYEARGDVTDGVVTLPVKATLETDSKGVAVSALGIWPITERWDVYGRIGMMHADTSARARISSDGVGSSASDSETSEEVLYGVGATLKASSQWDVRLDYQRFQDVGDEEVTGESSVDRLSVQWIYKF